VAAGERVVVTGQMTLSPGAKVRIDQAAPSASIPAGNQSSIADAIAREGVKS
jgi:hypothetical protein